MPVGILIREDEASVVRKAFQENEEGSPVLDNNLFTFSPRGALRIMTRIQNCEALSEDERDVANKFALRLADFVGKNYKGLAFEEPTESDTNQLELFRANPDEIEDEEDEENEL